MGKIHKSLTQALLKMSIKFCSKFYESTEYIRKMQNYKVVWASGPSPVHECWKRTCGLYKIVCSIIINHLLPQILKRLDVVP